MANHRTLLRAFVVLDDFDIAGGELGTPGPELALRCVRVDRTCGLQDIDVDAARKILTDPIMPSISQHATLEKTIDKRTNLCMSEPAEFANIASATGLACHWIRILSNPTRLSWSVNSFLPTL